MFFKAVYPTLESISPFSDTPCLQIPFMFQCVLDPYIGRFLSFLRV